MGKIKFQSLIQELQLKSNPQKAKFLERYFKTGKGEYGEGDVFIGLTLVQIGEIVKKYKTLPLPEIEKLLKNPIHEYRTTALGIMKAQWRKALRLRSGQAGEAGRKKLYNFYVKNRKHVNNWDLVDISAPTIVGGWMLEHPKERKLLYTFAQSKNLWERRIAILTTLTFIKQKDFTDALAVAELLLKDKEDLIHKAVGWMLREVGKMDEAALIAFLKKHYSSIPRTALRYSIEKFPPSKRQQYLKGAF